MVIGQHRWLWASGGTYGENLYSYEDFYGVRKVENSVPFGASHQILIKRGEDFIWIGADWRDLVFI